MSRDLAQRRVPAMTDFEFHITEQYFKEVLGRMREIFRERQLGDSAAHFGAEQPKTNTTPWAPTVATGRSPAASSSSQQHRDQSTGSYDSDGSSSNVNDSATSSAPRAGWASEQATGAGPSTTRWTGSSSRSSVGSAFSPERPERSERSGRPAQAGSSGTEDLSQPSPYWAPVPKPLRPIPNGATTLVVLNIPARLTAEELVDLWPPYGRYNLLHLPFNTRLGHTIGLAFVNFLTHELALEFAQQWHGQKLLQDSRAKMLEVGPAKVQGYTGTLLMSTRQLTATPTSRSLVLLTDKGERRDIQREIQIVSSHAYQ